MNEKGQKWLYTCILCILCSTNALQWCLKQIFKYQHLHNFTFMYTTLALSLSLMLANPRKTARGRTTLTCSLWKRFTSFISLVGRYAAYRKLDWISLQVLGQPQFSSVLEGRVIICMLALKHLTISTPSASEFTGPKLGLCFKHCEFVLFCICSDGSAWCSTGACLDSSWGQGEESRILGFNPIGFDP